MRFAEIPIWEYAELYLSREPDGDWPITCLFREADQEWELNGTDILAELNLLGLDGWELVGSPEVLNVVVPYTSPDGWSTDRAHWVERRFWLKRVKR